jgi:hypothetical protein
LKTILPEREPEQDFVLLLYGDESFLGPCFRAQSRLTLTRQERRRWIKGD